MVKAKPFVTDIENIRKRARQDIEQGAMTAGYEEQGHADLIAERITQLDGKPNLSPEGMLGRSHADYVEGVDLVDMIKEDLVAERIAIDSYREIIDYIGTDDPTTRRMLESILAMEEEHAEDMNTLLEQLGKKGEPAKPAPGKNLATKH
jgi:bacterioferritin